jgi:hypothetical protein
MIGSYIIEADICYLCICERSYPKKLAFSFLEELSKEFQVSHGHEAHRPGLRPYAFIKFGKKSKLHDSNTHMLTLPFIRYIYSKNKATISRY